MLETLSIETVIVVLCKNQNGRVQKKLRLKVKNRTPLPRLGNQVKLIAIKSFQVKQELHIVIIIVFGAKVLQLIKKVYTNASTMSILPNLIAEIQFMTLNVKIVKMRMKIVLSCQIWKSNTAKETRLCQHNSTMFRMIMDR